MIYQVLRRDPCWGVLGWLAPLWLAMALAAVLPLFRNQKDIVFGLLCGMSMGGVLATTFLLVATRRATLFEAALPISARDLFVARVLTLLGFVWLQVAAMAVPIAMADTPHALVRVLTPIQAGALATLMGLLMLSMRLRELARPPG